MQHKQSAPRCMMQSGADFLSIHARSACRNSILYKVSPMDQKWGAAPNPAKGIISLWNLILIYESNETAESDVMPVQRLFSIHARSAHRNSSLLTSISSLYRSMRAAHTTISHFSFLISHFHQLLTSHSHLLTIYRSMRAAHTTISNFSFLISNSQNPVAFWRKLCYNGQ